VQTPPQKWNTTFGFIQREHKQRTNYLFNTKHVIELLEVI
jgi:hypothetical protein